MPNESKHISDANPPPGTSDELIPGNCKKLFKFFSHLFLRVRSFGVFLVIFSHFVRHLAPLNSSQNRKICLKNTSQNN